MCNEGLNGSKNNKLSFFILLLIGCIMALKKIIGNTKIKA